jgi:hypothetical protein
MSNYSDIISDGGMDPRADYEAKRKIQNLESSIKDLIEVRLAELQLERDALWVKTQEDERIINDLRDAINEKNRWKKAALVVMSIWDKVSEYIRKNGDVNDLGKSIPELCLKYLMEKDHLKEIIKLNFMSDIPTNEKLLTQRTELLALAEEMAEVIIGNGASVKDAVPIDKLDEFYKKWNIGEPFVRAFCERL